VTKFDVERLVAQWRDTDKQRYAADTSARVADLFATLETLHLRIFREGDRGIDAFARLLEDADDRIRVDAAAALLPLRPHVAKAILVEAASRSLTARYVLSEWGRTSTPPTALESAEAEESARNRIAKLYAAIDERFHFIGSLGFRRAVSEKIAGAGVAQARFVCGDRYLDIAYDTTDGALDIVIGGGEFDQRVSLWEVMAVRGAWPYAGYTGHMLEAMRHGIEIAARHLDAHRDLLIADLSPDERTELKRRRASLIERAAQAPAAPAVDQRSLP
jgi:hypothetical protein